MKRILLATVMGALCATAAAEDRAGVAQSREAFDITRNSTEITQRANVLNQVRPGDVVRSTTSKVIVNLEDQSEVLINERSVVEFLEDGTLNIHEGAAVFHLPEGTARAVRHQDLVITTIENPRSANNGHVALVSSTSDGRLQIRSIREAFAVAQQNGEERLATIGDSDLLIFGRNNEGSWSIIDPDQGQPSRFRLAQDAPTAAPDEEDEEDRRRGAWWVVGGIALLSAAAVGGATYLIIEELRDDDDDDDERIEERPRRRPVSPIIRPDDDRYFDDEYIRDEFLRAG